MTQELKPSFFTIYEGGHWIDWPKDILLNVDDLTKRDYRSALIGGLYVHSIAFGNVLAGPHHFIRWDCINGFTDEPEEVIY